MSDFVSFTDGDTQAANRALRQVDITSKAALPATGGSMTGPLIVLPPGTPMEAAPRAYVDAIGAALSAAMAALGSPNTASSSTDARPAFNSLVPIRSSLANVVAEVAGGPVNITIPSSGAVQAWGCNVASPGTSWTFKTNVKYSETGGSSVNVLLQNSGSPGNVIAFYSNNNTVGVYSATNYDGFYSMASAYSGNSGSASVGLLVPNSIWMFVKYDQVTDRYFFGYNITDGVVPNYFFSFPRGSNGLALQNQVGIGGTAGGGSMTLAISALSLTYLP